MKKILATAAFAALGMTAALGLTAALGMTAAEAQTPQPADWTVLTFTANLNKPADIGWDRVGGNDWCGIARFLDLKGCTINSGKGELGSVRTVIVGTTPVVEIAVARTSHSYTYAQPFTPIFYHGTMAVEPVDATHSRLVYTLMWNQNGLPDAKARTDAREGRQRRFQIAVDKMAAAANAP
jgi:hypothetical protein